MSQSVYFDPAWTWATDRPAPDIVSPLDPLDPNYHLHERASGIEHRAPSPGFSSEILLGARGKAPPIARSPSPIQGMPIPGAFAAPMAMGSMLSTSPLVAGMGSFHMGMTSQPVGIVTEPFAMGGSGHLDFGMGPGALGLSASPTGAGIGGAGGDGSSFCLPV